jgi:hypothetical protein
VKYWLALGKTCYAQAKPFFYRCIT